MKDHTRNGGVRRIK